MKYPYFLMSGKTDVAPVVRLEGEPHMLILDDSMAEKALRLSGKSVEINDWFTEMIAASGCKWAVGSYLENRESILAQYEHMSRDRRYFHLGIDICAPAGTPVFAPMDGVVEESGYEEGEGNYGGYVILRHEPAGVEPFYTMYGHMALSSLPSKGESFRAGDRLALLGDLHENGGWNHHTHVQVITQTGKARGFFFKGYCSEKDLGEIELLCPNPLPLLAAGRCKL